MNKKIFTCILISFSTNFAKAELSSYEELIAEVADQANISKALAENIVDLTFKEITTRLRENKGTSIPEFGRFYVQEKYVKNGSSESISKKSTLNPRFTMSPDLKKKVAGVQ